MKPFLRNPLHILTSKWFAVVLISLLLSCLSIFPIANASAQTCYADWDITGTSGIKTNYQLGETISGSISFKINNPPDVPACIQQILVGLVDSQNTVIDVQCIYDARPKVCPEWTTGTVSVSWESPASPGTYRLLAMQDGNYSCADAKLNFRPKEPIKTYKNIATITVSASKADEKSAAPITPPLSPPTKEDSTTSSAGDGTTQDGGASKTGVSTQFIIVAIALLVLLFIFSLMASKARKGFIRFILVLAVVSFIGYLLWMYAIPAITDWFSKNLSTLIGTLLLLGLLVIAGIAIWKNWGKIRDWIPVNPPEPPPEPSKPVPTILKGIQFEQKCKAVLENMGFICETTKASGDGGIDIIAKSNKPLISGTYIIQCKDWKNRPVGEKEIRDLYGTAMSERANKGILITSSYFTKAALSFAQGKNIELIDGDKLNKLAEKD